MQLVLEHLSFTYPDSPAAVLTDVLATIPQGWTGVVGVNGSGKSTLLRIATGDLVPQSGRVLAPGDALYCAQPTSEAPALMEEFALDWTADAGRLRSLLRIGDDWPWRFETLSHGERKRLQLAISLWRQPMVLAVDEPTNHLDAEARGLVVEALRRFEGVGLIVSHDRELLDTLVSRCLFLGGSGVRLRPGTYTEARKQEDLERRSALAERASARNELARLKAEESRRRTEADRAHALRSRGRVDPADRDAKGRIGLAIVSGKDGQAGRLSAQMNSRLRRAHERLEDARVEKVPGGAGIRLAGPGSRRDVIARLAAGEIAIAEGRVLAVPDLVVGGRDRIAVTGPNGTGKSTLVRHLLGGLALPPERVLAIPQELDAVAVSAAYRALLALGADDRGSVLAFVARLGSDPDRLLSGESLSPGEVRKLMIAMGVTGRPEAVVLDEPTNHLDVVATEALEEALAEYDGALVLVSHDRRFIERLATIRWRLVGPDAGVVRVVVESVG